MARKSTPAEKRPGTQPARTKLKAANGGERFADVSSAAVMKATGRTWAQWLTLLDKAGAAKMPHKDIATLLHEQHGIPGWWSQTVTVGYEQARGLRKKHEKADGFAISGSRTIGIPVSRLFEAWQDDRLRRRWLPESPLSIRKATRDKSLRITWDPEGKPSNVDVYFTSKAADKSQVAVQHGRLPSAAAGERMKKFWGERLDALKQLLEG
jgi:uncharacterized protein YndB with AHSA1/START domain